jgi:hypothetical protein
MLIDDYFLSALDSFQMLLYYGKTALETVKRHATVELNGN